ncbi:MAG: coenzyme F420-0:L-glutamate ligase [Anaerolineae bacterium]|nr:coenzyme F420-0:L-glutamate ligase [Anaerolineae bacterium]
MLGLAGIPLIQSGDDLAGLIISALEGQPLPLQDRDVIVVTSKVVSKAEDRWVNLDEVVPSGHAREVAQQCGKDPREVEVILSEATAISRVRPGVIVTEHRLGFVSANSGIDHSNTRLDGNWWLLLPLDPDTSARTLRERLNAHFGVTAAVVISDSHGRPFRLGTVGVAVGAAGLPALWDWRGQPDMFGYILHATEVGFADEIAAAAGLVLGQAAEGVPVAVVRGLEYPATETTRASDLHRPRQMDMYR